ncbi:MAG: cation-transporting P-type ATPase [Methylococcaceae bacterium]|nr:cation-transporting P-type ATPase [Methylococcaceae bacterium]
MTLYTAEVVHQVHPGRIRLKTQAIYRREAVKMELEQAMLRISYVQSVRGNVLTGTFLILFDPQRAQTSKVLDDLSAIVGTIRIPSESAPRPPAASSESRWPRWLGRSVDSTASSKPAAATPARQISKRLPAPQLPKDAQRLAPPEAAWHALTATETLIRLDSSVDGLDDSLARRRLALYGPNALEVGKQRAMLSMVLDQFLNIPVAMLGVSAVVSVATGGIADACVIGGVVLINAVIGYLTERSAEKTINALGDLTPSNAWLIRDGRKVEVPLHEVVPGDVLILVPGAYIPADARLIAANSLSVDESALTGESLPVQKNEGLLLEVKIPLGDRANMVHMGTVVTGGSGLAVVTASGKRTEIGHIQALVGEVATPETPLQRQLDQMGVKLAAFSAGICVLVFGVGVLRGLGWLQMLNSSISLAVAAVPEGLPAVATTTLALGIREMKRRRVLVRQLPAVESLGSVQVLCLDKTGTLTMNKMKVVALRTEKHALQLRDGHYRNGDGLDFAITEQPELVRLLEVVSLCSEVTLSPESGLDGSPTECALIEAAQQGGLDIQDLRARLPLLKLEHRAEQRPYMSSVHLTDDGGYFIAVKGSPSDVLKLSTEWQCGDRRLRLNKKSRQTILAQNEEMAGEALRVLGVAYGYADGAETDTPNNLVWLGLIGMEDIIRPGMPELMAQFHAAGIETVMITGDQSATAYSVGKRLGLNHDKNLEILDSIRLDQIDPEVLAHIVKDTSIFARVSPAHKLRIVQALQKSGRVIAMTGDGINDGPALKAADVGVAMGKQGTDVARAVADVVLQDDNLHTMITAVEQGRTIYNNIRKSLRFLLATNLSEIEVMLITTALGLGEALNPMQLLWINLVTDIFPALALAMEPPERDVLKQAPRDPRDPIIGRKDTLRLLRESSVITAGTIGVYAYSVARYGAGMQASTNTFMTLTVAQFLQSISCRSETTTILDRSRPGNRYLGMAIAGSLGLQALTVLLPPLRALLRLSPVTLVDLLMIMAGSGAPFFINETTKTLRLTRSQEPKLP